MCGVNSTHILSVDVLDCAGGVNEGTAPLQTFVGMSGECVEDSLERCVQRLGASLIDDNMVGL